MKSNDQIAKLKLNLKKRNYKAFFFFIGFTLLIWLFVQMSKPYEHEVELSLQLDNIPQTLVIENSKQKLKAKVKQSGFKILTINLFNSSLLIDYSELDSINNHLQYDLNKHKPKIAKALSLGNDEFDLNQDSVQFIYYQLATKKLKIKPNFKVSFSKGYDSLSGFKFNPEYIEVSGNDSILKALEYISTDQKNFKNVSDTIYGSIDIELIDSASINYVTETIDYFLPVAKFTEGIFEIPITLEDSSLNDKLIIFPKSVKVSFRTSLSNFEKIDESGFKVVAKYKPEDEFMILELVEKPKLVNSVSLETHKVDYLIRK